MAETVKNKQANPELEEYKKYVRERLEALTSILANVAVGDFSKMPEVSQKKDEFTELYAEARFMMQDLKFMMEKEEATTAAAEAIAKDRARLKTLEEFRKEIAKRANKLEDTRSTMIYMLRDLTRAHNDLERAKAYTENIIESMADTLSGGVKILNDVLSLVNPVAYEIACRIRNYVRHITTQLKLSNSGQFEIAAMLSQIGCIIVPQSILHKVYTGQSLSDAEYEKFFSHPSTAYRLLISIPRLESVASIVQGQQRSLNSYAPAKDLTQQNSVALGSQPQHQNRLLQPK